MAVTETLKDIEYPESDGQPMGETELHKRWIIRLYDQLGVRFRNERTYVGSDLLMYYEEGNTKKFVVPDVFVAKGCEPGLRNTFQIWNEQRVPNVVFEVTSNSTKDNDAFKKPALYASIGVNELILFDPTCDYLEPPLQLLRRVGQELVRQEPDLKGEFLSEELDAKVFLNGDQLVLLDRETRSPFLTEAEFEAQLRQAASRRADLDADYRRTESRRADAAEQKAEAARLKAAAESQRADDAERGRAELAAELERLRESMRRQGRSD